MAKSIIIQSVVTAIIVSCVKDNGDNRFDGQEKVLGGGSIQDRDSQNDDSGKSVAKCTIIN